jgi:hypothetical protein
MEAEAVPTQTDAHASNQDYEINPSRVPTAATSSKTFKTIPPILSFAPEATRGRGSLSRSKQQTGTCEAIGGQRGPESGGRPGSGSSRPGGFPSEMQDCPRRGRLGLRFSTV